MASFEDGIYDLGRLDRLAYLDTPVHHIDPRAKVIVTAVYLGCVVSFGKYDVLPMVPFLLYPVFTLAEGGLPTGFLLRKLLAVAPFAVFVGMFNPILDRAVVAEIAGIGISGGWVSFVSILARFSLTTIAALTLVATTGMGNVCAALGRLGMPDVLVTQTLLLYRYLFVLGGEAMRLARAHSLRRFGGRGLRLAAYVNVLGHLLLRTYGRAERVYQAMLSRGFSGRVAPSRALRFGLRDAAYAFGWSAAFVTFRLYDAPLALGRLLTGALS